jgi:hypothetical protein
MISNESICYLLRKTTLTLEQIGKLSPIQFNSIVAEVSFQESIEQHNTQLIVANLLAAIYNTIPRKRGSKTYKANDFLKGESPQRIIKETKSIDELAEARGIKLPKER